MNILLNEFLATADARYADDSSTTSMSEYVVKNTRLKRKPYSFKGYEFQQKIIDDLHPNLCCIKCSQIGLTESQLRKFLAWLRRNVATAGIYTMPNDNMRDRVSQTRVKPLIISEPIFNPPRSDTPIRQKGLYQIDDSFAYFTGNTEGDATSIPADFLMHDELDLSDQQIIGLFQSRLQASQFKIRQSFSTPTYLGYGIDAMYSVSDQFEYFVRCPKCRQHQLPEFTPKFMCLPGLVKKHDDLTTLTSEEIDMIEMDGVYWRCEKCSAELDLADPLLREWVARHPSRSARGYRVRPTSVATIGIPYIFQQLREYQRLDNMKGFHNTVLGEGFNDANARLTEADIRACMGTAAEPEVSSDVPCFIGIDAGNICHVTVGAFGRAFLWLQVPRADLRETAINLFKRFNIVAGAMDRYPYTDLAESIRDIEEHKNIIWPMGYGTTPNVPPLKEFKDEFENVTHWVCNRTKALDYVASAIRNRHLSITGYGQHQSVIISHLRDMVRIENPETPPVWNKTTGDDHFHHSLSYMLLAQRLIQVINFNSDAEVRSNVLLIGGTSLPIPDLSPHSLNRAGARRPEGILAM